MMFDFWALETFNGLHCAVNPRGGGREVNSDSVVSIPSPICLPAEVTRMAPPACAEVNNVNTVNEVILL